ncbi:MAG TPA: glutamate--tRNA ligase [Rhodospirillales bacterium]
MTVVTRFAPSPTGFLHIGSARTALYNWLFAKHHAQYGAGGRFLLRIEDTDRQRSTQEAVDAIIDGLRWLGLDWDGEAISQFSRVDRHAEIAHRLLAEGSAYKCFCTPEELQEMRDVARREGRPQRYDGRWRDRDPAEAPKGVDPVIRLKAPLDGETAIEDLVYGKITVGNDQLDDMVLLRGDGTPTYMLAVVVDDHDTAVTHIIRGADHQRNTFRQYQLYKALGWEAPLFAHLPLIHGADGAKLSKRHGAVGVESYRHDGFLPEALCNYLLRLGWSHGDDDIIGRNQAVEWFGLEAIGRSAARFDPDKLASLNGHYIRQTDDGRLLDLVMPRVRERLQGRIADAAEDRVRRGMGALKERARTLVELAENAEFYAAVRPIPVDTAAAKALDAGARKTLTDLRARLAGLDDWAAGSVEAAIRAEADTAGRKLGQVAQPLRAALTGRTVSPGLFEVMEILGRDECLGRLDDVCAGAK